ncbi:hypothetical protein [Acidovorax sp. M2(2025)]|uniref:hypothetical protein n=1 Tax=Acidovorax sp. M2(2025) TaxID=3411355 RepID=UPI003BF5E0BF
MFNNALQPAAAASGMHLPGNWGRIVSKTGTVSLRPAGFSLIPCGVQFIPSMSRTRKGDSPNPAQSMD